MAQLLNPPPTGGLASFAPRANEVFIMPAGRVVWRVYFQAPRSISWNTFRNYGPTSSRFDHHAPPPGMSQNKAILYGAATYPTCLAEVFQSTRVLDRRRNAPYLAAFAFDQDIPLLDLTGPWPTRAGASMAINSGSRAVARQWSSAIHATFPNVCGLRYASSMDGNRPAFAFYERAQAHIASKPKMDRPLSHPALLGQLRSAAHRFGYGLI